jgi:hypothetical protein
MGAWGLGPLDNDEAVDWFDKIQDKIEATIGGALNTAGSKPFLGKSVKAFAAIGVLAALGQQQVAISPDGVYEGIRVLQRMLEPNEPADWDDPESRRKMLQSYIVILQRLLPR